MQSLKNHIVFITGASSGIGQACAEQFAAQGARLIVTARRLERLEALSTDLAKRFKTKCLPLALDVRDRAQVNAVIAGLPSPWNEVSILVNNAGLALASTKLQDGNPEDWDTMIQTNIAGLLYVTRAILPGMIKREQGHVINIGSVAGHDVYPTGNVYCATKHAVRGLSKGMRMDLLGTPIRVSEVDPGAVETEFSEVRWKDKEKARKFYEDFTPLVAADIADAVLYCASRPPHVNIAEICVYPVAQASVNHVHRT